MPYLYCAPLSLSPCALHFQVLGGQMLDLWEERAREVQANGWYWEYTFISLDVSHEPSNSTVLCTTVVCVVLQ